MINILDMMMKFIEIYIFSSMTAVSQGKTALMLLCDIVQWLKHLQGVERIRSPNMSGQRISNNRWDQCLAALDIINLFKLFQNVYHQFHNGIFLMYDCLHTIRQWPKHLEVVRWISV